MSGKHNNDNNLSGKEMSLIKKVKKRQEEERINRVFAESGSDLSDSEYSVADSQDRINEYHSITKNDGTPFKVFSPFWRNAEQVFLDAVPQKMSEIKKLKSKIVSC